MLIITKLNLSCTYLIYFDARRLDIKSSVQELTLDRLKKKVMKKSRFPGGRMDEPERQSDRQTDRHTIRHTIILSDRPTDRKTIRQADRLTIRQTERQSERQTDRQSHRRTDRQSDR